MSTFGSVGDYVCGDGAFWIVGAFGNDDGRTRGGSIPSGSTMNQYDSGVGG